MRANSFALLVSRLGGQLVASHRKLMATIVGFRVAIARVEAAWKLSQNQSPARRKHVARHLAASPDSDARAIARRMRGGPE